MAYIIIKIVNYMLIIFFLFICLATSEDIILNINLKKLVATVSENFLSITLDPVILFNSDTLNDIEKTSNMAKALAPAYVRIAGPRSNSYIFERGLYPLEIHSDPNYIFTETHWVRIHQWAEKSGLDVIACITPQQFETSSNNDRTTFWDPRNALDLISFSDHMGYNTSWQLGYECQTRCDVSGNDLGRDVQHLRNMLDAFPRYAERGLIVGPDVITYKSKQQQQYLQEFFNAAGSSLSAITWHPDFASINVEDEEVSIHYDNLAHDKERFYRFVGRHVAKKPLWIAESKTEECKSQFLGALVWTRRLGNSAKLGIQVLMRQPNNSNLFRPTPDYWVSVLHKMLVGREVLDMKITTGNRTHVHFYCQCTKPSSKYEKGSLTVFGINLTPSKITVTLKGIKVKIVHKYILLPGYDTPNRMFAETILLNNEPLNLIDGKEIPNIQPAISSAEKGVKLKLPSGGIGFWVLPDLKIKSCMTHEDEVIDKNLLKKINRHFKESDVDVESELENENIQENTDVVNSVEERKPPLRLQRTIQKRLLLRRSNHLKDNNKNTLDERKLHKLDGARRDFNHFEKKIRKKDQHAVNIKSGSTHRIFENSNEDDNDAEEDILTIAVNGSSKLNSEEIIRAKLQEYKKRLNDYENRKKQHKLISNIPKKSIKDEISDSINKGMDTEKVIEALTLITKVESAMKGLEKENESEIQITRETPTLGTSDSNDVTAGLQRNNSDSQRDDDALLDEILNSEKSKRTSVPTRIEDQLKALYRLLSEEKEKQDNQSSLRQKRDLDKNLNNGFLDLHRENIFVQKPEKPKEHFMEHINEHRQRFRRRHDIKRKKEELKNEFQDSNENNFYGFQHHEPLKHFPEGDVYFQTENNSHKRENIDHKYINDDIDKMKMYLLQINKNSKHSNIHSNMDKQENTLFKEGKMIYKPNKFHKNAQPQPINNKANLKNNRELWEIQSIYKNGKDVTNSKKSVSDTLNSRKPIINKFNIKNIIPIKNGSLLYDDVKKVYEIDFFKKSKELIKNPSYIKTTMEIPIDSNKNLYKRSINYNKTLVKFKKPIHNNFVNNIKNKNLSIRKIRSLDQNYDYKIIKSNRIDDLENSEINEIWHDVDEIRQNKKLLQNYNQHNGNVNKNVLTEYNIKNYVKPIAQYSNIEANLSNSIVIEHTTQKNLKSILVDAIPKLKIVVTGGLMKAENLTDPLEYLIDTFDNKLNNTNVHLRENTENVNTYIKNERLSHNIFKIMVGSVKKFFGFVSGITKIFHKD